MYWFQNIDNAQAIQQGMNQLILDSISERVNGYLMKIHLVEGKSIITLYLPPESSGRPHMVTKDRRTDFYCRYGKDKRVMTVAEIKSMCMGDAVERKVFSIEDMVKRLLERNVLGDNREKQLSIAADPGIICDIGDVEVLAVKLSELFSARKNASELFRLCAIPINPINSFYGDKARLVPGVIQNPPDQRRAGWNVGGYRDIRRSAGGWMNGDDGHYETVVWDNGVVEFIDGISSFFWASDKYGLPNHPFVNPYSIVGFVVSFTRFVKALHEMAGYSGGHVLLCEFHGLKNTLMRPYTPQQFGFMHERKVLKDRNDIVINEKGDDLISRPDNWAFRVVKKFYSHYGFSEDEVPFFSDPNRADFGKD